MSAPEPPAAAGTRWLIEVTAEAEVIRGGAAVPDPEEPAGPAESSST